MKSASSEPEIREVIQRAAWRSAKCTEDIAPHQYVVRGWDRDDVTEEEFWDVVNYIRTHGREEIWTPPAEWQRRWGGRPMKNTYWYPSDGYAYWFTWPRGSVPMLNREHVSVQEQGPTREVIQNPVS